MIIKPKIRGFICTTAHPEGCALNVKEQIDFIKQNGQFKGPKTVLVIGCSTGYGLASRIAAAFGAGAKTIGVCYERPAEGNRTATAGWYNTAAFERFALDENIYAKTINGDAFAEDIKQQTIDAIKQELGKIDLIIYSLASPVRKHPDTGVTHASVLKPIAQSYQSKTVDPIRREVKAIELAPASQEEIDNTVAVMGGDDWQRWVQRLADENLLAEGVITLAYNYVGPELTHPIYKNGTIGRAKEDLLQTAEKLNTLLKKFHGQAIVSVNKALVTQASAAIPVVPLYISLLYKVMKVLGTHEGCIEQINRLFKTKLYTFDVASDEQVRMDDWEMEPAVQQQIIALWTQIDSTNVAIMTDIDGYMHEFHKLFGFGFDAIDYDSDVTANVNIPSIA